MRMDNLLEHRWQERDRALNEKILAVQNQMNRRGILASSISAKEHHELFRTEFRESIAIIVKSVIDSLQSTDMKFDRVALQKWSIEKLKRRRDILNSIFLERVKVSIQSCQNQAMIAPFMSVSQYCDHMAQELRVELNQALDSYESQFGKTFTDRIINGFKNRPLIAFGIVVIAVVSVILSFVTTLRDI